MTFDGFISYSHAGDGKLAPALQDGLQRLGKSPFERRALRVFRDETGLSTNPHLWGSIEQALDESEWFVLLASPAAAASTWVTREVETWLERKQSDRLLLVVTEGEIAFTDDGKIDRASTTCLPAPLLTAFETEPRWLDLRWARRRRSSISATAASEPRLRTLRRRCTGSRRRTWKARMCVNSAVLAGSRR